MFMTYAVLSMFAFVMMKSFEGFNGLEKNDKMFGKLTKFSLGNIGFAKSQCFFQYTTLKSTQHLKCHKGTLSKIKHWGATASTENQMLRKFAGETEDRRVGHDFCGDP